MLTCRGTLVVNLTVVNVTQRTVVNRLEGRYIGGVGFGDITAIKHGVVHHYQYATISGGFISCGHYRVIQVEWTVCAHGRGRAHCADHHHRFVAFHRQVEEVSGFFHRVGTVGNDEAVGFIAVGVNFFRQCQPDIIVHVLGADIHYLLAFNVRNVLQLRHRINQIFYANFTRCVVRFGCGVTTTGNGPAGC